jgi:hypothetical protein
MDEDLRILKILKKSDNGIESYSTKGVPKMFPKVAALLGYMHSCPREILQR